MRRSSAGASTPASKVRSPTSPASRSSTATRTWCCRAKASRRSSSRARRATSASTAPRGSRSRSSPTARAIGSPTGCGLDYVMAPRDYAALEGAAELVPWDVAFDHARAVKSDEELESVRDSVQINTAGFHLFCDAYEPGRSAAEVMAPAEELFVERGCGRLTMNMVLVGAEFAIARAETTLGEFCIPSLEIAGRGGHWVEVSRALGTPNDEVKRMNEAYDEYFEAAKSALRPGATAHDAHRAVSQGFTDRGYHLGHVTGHSIGMTMIEFPKIGEGVETELRENMVFSMHPHVIAENGHDCLYMQETWLVTADGGVPLSGLESKIF